MWCMRIKRGWAWLAAAILLALVTAQVSAARADSWIMLIPAGVDRISAEPAVALSLKGLTAGPTLEVLAKPGTEAARSFKQALRKGEATVAEIPLSVLARESALYAADQIAYLATTTAEAERLFEQLAPVIARRLAEDDLVLLALLPQPARGLFTKRPVAAAADLAKQPVWAPTAATRRLAEHFGGTPTVEHTQASAMFVTPDEIARLVPAQAGGWTFQAAAGWHGAHAVVVAAKAWQALGPDAANTFRDNLRVYERAHWNALAAVAASDAARLAAAGHSVAPMPADVSAELARAGRRMAAEWMPGAGADGAAWLAAIGAAKPEVRR